MSRFLLVVLAEDLEHGPFPTTRNGAFTSIRSVNGVECVADLEVISPQTLEQWMLPRDQALGTPTKRRRNQSAKRTVNGVND